MADKKSSGCGCGCPPLSQLGDKTAKPETKKPEKTQ